jgi:hypothetical protein
VAGRNACERRAKTEVEDVLAWLEKIEASRLAVTKDAMMAYADIVLAEMLPVRLEDAAHPTPPALPSSLPPIRQCSTCCARSLTADYDALMLRRARHLLATANQKCCNNIWPPHQRWRHHSAADHARTFPYISYAVYCD